jgi:1-acyl-sn-glycerol-3-phosphate acyltransferase
VLSTQPHVLKRLATYGALTRAILRILLLVLWLTISLISQIAGFLLRTGDGRHLRLRFYRGALRILGIRIQEFGTFSSRRPLFLVANHVSYLDIFILGSLIPAVFVSKYEVRHWPLVGWIAAIQKTIFISRKPSRAASEVTPITEALNDAYNVIVFPEGTSTDGQQVSRFKTTLFEAPIQANAFIQPVGLVYRDRRGGELSEKDRAFYTWGTDAPFFTHFLKLIVRPGVLVEVWIRPVIAPDQSRKQLANQAEQRVRSPIRRRTALKHHN